MHVDEGYLLARFCNDVCRNCTKRSNMGHFVNCAVKKLKTLNIVISVHILQTFCMRPPAVAFSTLRQLQLEAGTEFYKVGYTPSQSVTMAPISQPTSHILLLFGF